MIWRIAFVIAAVLFLDAAWHSPPGEGGIGYALAIAMFALALV